MKKKKALKLTGGGFSLLMKNLRDIFKGRRRVWLGISFLFLIGLFVVFVNKSYALWSVSVEKPGQMKIVAGTLQYRLDSVKLTNNKLTVAPGESFDFTIDIVSLNTVSSKYVLYYEGTLPSGVKFGCVETAPEGTIGTMNAKRTFVLRAGNDSPNTVTLTLGVQGGFSSANIVLISGRNKLSTAPTVSYSKQFVYTGTTQKVVIPYYGYYKIELWGAQGGSNVGTEGSLAGNVGGLGGYTSGIIYLDGGTPLTVEVGGQGSRANYRTDQSSKGYNGGGIGGYEATCYDNCMKGGGGGGGATDIRLDTTLKSRIIVAAGGGGAGNWFMPKAGGSAGLLIGNSGMEYGSSSNFPFTNATGGKQSLGGTGAIGATSNGNGTLGVGSDANTGYNNVFGGGGGGGYYGGGGGGHNTSVVGSGAGGSSYMSGFGGSNSLNSSGVHTNDPLHYSNLYFRNGQLMEGANQGNGKAEINYLGSSLPKQNTKLNNIRYIKDCTNGNTANVANHWYEIQAVKDGRNIALNKTTSGTSGESSTTNAIYRYMVDGRIDNGLYSSSVSNGLQCFTVDLGGTYDLDEVAVWHYFGDGRSYNNHTLSVGPTNQSGTTSLATVLINNRSGILETSNGFRFNAWQ